MEVEVEADAILTSDTHSDRAAAGTPDALQQQQQQTFACDEASPSEAASQNTAPESGGDSSGEEGAEPASESVCQSGAAPAAEVREEEARGDNQSVTMVTWGHQAAPIGKVIVTNVTINSLTVTFKEATVAEGFFKGY